MRSKIHEKSEKCRKKGMPKTMPKFDTEKKLKSAILAAILIPGGCRQEVRRASLRRRRLRHTGFINLKRLTPAGVGGFLGPAWIQNGSKIALLGIGWHLDPPKMRSGRGFGKKLENLMKKRCENRRFLMAQNHVWRYTLRLFYTFAIFEKYKKNNAKIDAKSCHFWFKN